MRPILPSPGFRASLVFLFLCGMATAIRGQSFSSWPGPLGTIHCLATDSSHTLFAGTHTKGVYRFDAVKNTWTGVGGNTIMTGRINDLLWIDGSILWAATEQGGVRTWDGNSWSAINTGLPTGCGLPGPVRALGMDADGQRIAGLHSWPPCWTSGGLFKWSASGWTPWDQGLPSPDINVLVRDPGDGRLLTGTDGQGIWRLLADTWFPWNEGLVDLHIYSLLVDSSGTAWAGTRSGLQVRKAGASGWQAVGPGLPDEPVLAIAVNPSDPDHVVVSTGYPAELAGSLRSRLYHSTDGGASWMESATQIRTTAIRTIRFTGPDVLDVGGWGFFRSTDHGATWATNNIGYSGRSFSSGGRLAILDTPSTTIFYGTDEGLFRTSDQGQSWQWASEGLDRAMITLLFRDRQNNLYCGAMRYLGGPSGGFGDGRLMRSADQGDTWSPVAISTDWRYLDMAEGPDGALYCAHGFGAQPPSATIIGSSLARSIDHGLTWTDLPVMSGLGFCTTVTPTGDLFVAGESEGTWRSTDQGQSWTLLPIPDQNSNLTVLASSPTGELILSGGAFRGLLFSSPSENGDPWHTYDDPGLPDYQGVSDAFFTQDGTVWLTTRGQNGAPPLFSLSSPLQSNGAMQIVSSLNGPLLHMARDACGYLYIYSPGTVLKSDLPLDEPRSECAVTHTDPIPSAPRDERLVVFPNPTSGPLTLDLGTDNDAKRWTLVDAIGSTIRSGTLDLDGLQHHITLDLSTVPNGFYTLVLYRHRAPVWARVSVVH